MATSIPKPLIKSTSNKTGRQSINISNDTTQNLICSTCGRILPQKKFHESRSELFAGSRHLFMCDSCIKEMSENYKTLYLNELGNAENKAIRRMCMILDIYYNENIIDESKKYTKYNFMIAYLRTLSNYTDYIDFTYDDTIQEDHSKNIAMSGSNEISDENNKVSVSPDTVRFFGVGFTDEDYIFLKEQYDDWVTRHECKDKAQEEIFKRLAFKQLEILKATRKGENTKELDATFQKLLETAHLQPKQNVADTLADKQTFGTLLEKWENTRPVPEIDEELKDVDKIGLYIDVFFKGHLAKMMGLKNGLSNLYNKFISKYTVHKPEYENDEDENSEVIFDAIFGNASLDDDEIMDEDGDEYE